MAFLCLVKQEVHFWKLRGEESGLDREMNNTTPEKESYEASSDVMVIKMILWPCM